MRFISTLVSNLLSPQAELSRYGLHTAHCKNSKVVLVHTPNILLHFKTNLQVTFLQNIEAYFK